MAAAAAKKQADDAAAAAAKQADEAAAQGKKADGPSCPTNSFTPDTPVLMADGTRKPIEEVRVGDEVLATDPETGRTEAREVTALIVGEGSKNLVEVTVDGAATDEAAGTIIATDGHPFWVVNRGRWVDAKDLRPGDLLRTAGGTYVQVGAVRAWTATARVHNLTVDDIHTYHVAAGALDVLVHNAGCGTGKAKTGPKPAGQGPHNTKIKAVADSITDGEVIAGGQRLPERLIKTTGGLLSGRRPDILVQRPDGSMYGINVGLQSRRTGAPIKREAEAINDLEGPGGLEMHFVPYN